MKPFNLEPPPHDGINLWVMSSARKCQLAGIERATAERLIMAFQGQTRRPIRQNEVERALARAYSQPLPENRPEGRAKRDPDWQPHRTRRTAYRPFSREIREADLWEASPWRCDDGLTQKMILRELFPDPAGLVCIGKTAYKFRTARLNQFGDLSRCQYIVPCYMTKIRGTTKDGKQSMHCLDNTGPRRFCVCDFDEPRSADHASIIWQLKRTFRLVMALNSGGKSLHAWFSVRPESEPAFWKAALPLGADIALMRNRSSFVRLPEGRRSNGRLQGVLYFDPGAIIEFDACQAGAT